MTDYFLAANGNNVNSGKLSTAPWQTLARLNSAFSLGEVGRGDRVFLRRGDTFSGSIVPPDNINPAIPGWLSIGAYGSGELPIVSGYQTLTGWVQHDANTWRVNLVGDVGFIKTDTTIRGAKRSALAGLTAQWDFYSSGTILYVRSSANPSTLATTIRATLDQDGVQLRSGVRIRDIHIQGFGAHGLHAVGRGGSTRAGASGLRISEIGGSYLDGYGDGTVRYGNGVQVWVGSDDISVEQCRVHDVYDVAFTTQGSSEGSHDSFDRIKFRRNLTYRCSQAYEFWFSGAGAGFVDNVVEYNTALFSGYGWGAAVRPEQQSRVALLTFAWEAGSELSFRHNLIYDSAYAYRYSDVATPGLDASGNIVALRPGIKMQHQTTQTIEQAAAWALANNTELGTKFLVLPAGTSTASDAEVATALTALDRISSYQLGPVPGATHFLPIHSPWR